MMDGMDYQYPDIEDKITVENIKKIELYPGYWNESENAIINIINELIKKSGGYLRFLDAGCREGRLITAFEKRFDEVVAIDPDEKRLKVAESIAENQRLSHKITFRRAAIEDFNDNNRFDFILCSHVIQHVHTEIVPVIIKKFGNLIKRDGLLCITTCHSTKEKSYFVKDFLNKSQLLEMPITEEEFNAQIIVFNVTFLN